MDREETIRHFARMSDEQFTVFATHEVGDLKPEAVEIVRAELHRRRTVPDPDATIDVQLRLPSSEEFEAMLARFRRLPCFLCGSTAGLLNGIWVNRGGDRETVVACVPCLRQELDRASGRSSATPWLGALIAPHLVVRAPSGSEAELRAIDAGEPTQPLREYLWFNRGEWAHLLKGEPA